MTDQQRYERFLHWLHDDQAGYIEIVAGATNPERPKKINLLMDTRQWFYLDPERPDLYAAAGVYAAQLAADYSNVYTGIRLYRSKKRAEDNVKPGRVIFIDDAPAAPAIPYSASIRTSEHSRHAYYKCAESVTKDDARRAMAALGGDPSGVDLTQLVRFPGTFNTKNNGRWSVEPESTPGTIYNLNELRSAWPAVVAKVGTGIVTDLDWPAVEHWLGRAGALMDEQSIPRRFKPHQQSYRVLTGAVIPVNKEGQADDSTYRAFLARGLCWARYPDDAAAAILWKHTSPDYLARKGTAWHKDDIARVITKERLIVAAQVADYKIRPITTAELSHSKNATPVAIVAQPARSRARADRPRLFDPAMLFARYQTQPELCAERRKARAQALGISTATLDRLEDSLEAIGLIEIQAQPGMPGRVVLLGGVINIAQPEVLSAPIADTTPEAPIVQAQSGENVDRAPQCKGETHPPREAPGVRPRRAALVAEAFDALDGCARLTDKRIRQYLEMNYPDVTFSAATLRLLATNERTRRRYAKQDAREMQKARALFGEALRKKSRAIAGAAAQMHRSGDKRAPIWDRRAGIYAQIEAERQQAEAERIQRLGYSLTEQAEMLELVEQVRLERKPMGKAAARAACVPPNPAPAGAPDSAALLTNLFARKGLQYNPAEYRQQAQP